MAHDASLIPATSRASRGDGASEAEVKAALLNTLSEESDLDAQAVVSELTLLGYENRADLVLVTDRTHCFEIKTKRDSLSRLDQQLSAYKSVFDLVSVVVATKHMNAALSRVPAFVGVYEVFDRGGAVLIKRVRRPTLHKELIKEQIVRSLPLSSLSSLIPNAKKGWKRHDFESAACKLSMSAIRGHMRAFLKERYGLASSALMTSLIDGGVSVADLKRLSRWRDSSAEPFEKANVQVVDARESTFVRYLSDCFGPVPLDIVAQLSSFNHSTAPRWAPRSRQNELVDEGDC
jgi:hypothetical protein